MDGFANSSATIDSAASDLAGEFKGVATFDWSNIDSLVALEEKVAHGLDIGRGWIIGHMVVWIAISTSGYGRFERASFDS